MPIDAGDGLDASALHCAAEAGRLDVVRSLLQHGADVRCRSEYVGGPLNTAASGDLAVAYELVLAGADVAARAARGETPLPETVIAGNRQRHQHAAEPWELSARRIAGLRTRELVGCDSILLVSRDRMART